MSPLPNEKQLSRDSLELRKSDESYVVQCFLGKKSGKDLFGQPAV